jgi:subtilisin
LRRALLVVVALLGLAAPAHAGGPRVVLLQDNVSDVETFVTARSKALGFGVKLRYRAAVHGFAASLDDRQIATLSADPNVLMVVPDATFTGGGTEALATGETAPPGVRRIGAGSPTTASTAAAGAVAVLDTGIDLAHPDLAAKHGVNCIAPAVPATDDNGHGTHVAGTIAARNRGRDIVGVAPGTTVYSVKVLNSKSTGTLSQLLCGIDWVRANAAALGITTANMSLSGSGSDDGSCGRVNKDAQHVAICNAVAAGVTFAVSAGNNGRSIAGYIPAAYREVLTATGMNDADGLPGAKGTAWTGCKTTEKDDRYGTYSNYAATAADAAHVVAAPGTCVASTKRVGGIAYYTGTSQAAPHVAGAVAACRSPGAPCAGLSPAATIVKMRELASSVVGAGFAGDPLSPLSGKTYGPLVSARW